MLIVPDILTGDNYREWARSIELAVEGRGRIDYLTGEATVPSSSNAQAVRLWKTENSLVASWLINAMAPAIKRRFMLLPTARDIWDAVHEAYSDGENVSHNHQMFEIKTKLWQMKQGTGSLVDYYLTMKALWQEVDLHNEEETWECPEDAALYRKYVERERLFEFLAGINSELDAARDRILNRVPLPTVREAFAEFKSEDSWRRIMMKDDPSEPSALATRNAYPRRQKGKTTCEHCKKTGHTEDTCWDIRGKVQDWRPRNNRGHVYQ